MSEWRIKITGTVTLGEEAQVNADIIAKNVVSSGKTNGSILAKQSVHLNQNGELTGKIKTKNLEMDKTFSFAGFCEIFTE